jgi:hypothetical protein
LSLLWYIFKSCIKFFISLYITMLICSSTELNDML